jgi:hypothetical protein
LLLLAAACLKLAGLKANLGGQGTLHALTPLLAAGELILGSWLVSGRVAAVAWAVASLTFVVFAVAASLSVWAGQATCGCFGVVRVDPKWALLADVVVLAALLAVRPRPAELFEQLKRSGPALAVWVGGPALVVAALVAVALWWFPSLEASVAWLRGEPLLVTPGVVDLGPGKAGESRTAEVTVANLTDRPVRLIGGTSDCACTMLGDLPLTIPAGEWRAVPVTVKYPIEGRGAFTRSLSLRTDCDRMRVVRFEATGALRAAEEGPE